jgi:transposase
MAPRPEERALCRLSRTHARLVKDKTVVWSRLRAHLLELAPEILHKQWKGPKYRTKGMLYILERWPAFEGLERAQLRSIEKILFRCRYGKRAPEMARLLKAMATQISMDMDERKIIAMEIALLLQQMNMLETSQQQIDEEIALRVQAHPIGVKLLEMPGLANWTAGVLIGELLPVTRNATEGQAATYSGVTPLARKSGKSLDRKRLARGVNKRILDVLYKSSVVAIGVSAIDNAYYQKKLRGYSGHPKPHTAAFIALSRQRHKVIYILMTSNVRYDKETLISSHLNRVQQSRAA